MDHELDPRTPHAALRAIEDEQLDLYLSWAQVEIPRWYWPTFAATVSVWVASYSLGVWGGVVGALLAASVFGAMAGALAHRSGLLMPRVGAMPPALRRSLLLMLAAFFAVVAIVLMVVVLLADPPFVLIGALVGPSLGLLGAAGTWRLRVAASELSAQRQSRRWS